MAEFSRNMAFIIGINNYTNGISSLHNAVNDAKKLIEILQQKHEYKVQECLDEVATLNNLNEFLEKILPEQVSENDRLLFYFAGHGIALNGDDGPEGYLIPQDAKLGDVQTYLPMTKLQESLSKLPCRHFLGILDCCFAGAFRWSSNRDLLTAPEVIHKERYDRFITDPAWQVITSAASDQKALDAFALNSERRQGGIHSPFAAALIEALAGKADIYPAPPGDGVITAQELYVYLRDEVELATEGNGQRQTPGIWPLKKHDKGEYIFLSPGHPLNLPPAPPLDTSKNPYRGLESYNEEHSELFFGRTELVEKLHNFVKTHPLTVVLGASGSGKSSLVKAGLIPQLRQDNTEQWCILPLIRPGETPMQALNNALKNAQLPEVLAQNIEHSLAMSIDTWAKNHPKIKLLLFIDQSEEIITLCQNEDERKEFFQQILKAINIHRDRLRVVLSLRSDFEPQVRDAGLKFVDHTVNNLENTVLESRWYSGRFIIPAMTRGELRQAIEKPAETRVMYFQPHELVEQLIDEVADMPGALPLLSFALSELYLKYLKRQRDAQNEGITIDRALTQEDYQDLGGVIQSLTKRADEEYETLVKENPAYAQIIRHVMLRMIALGGGELARRRVPLSELEYPPEKNSFVTAVIERFTKARLLVKGDDIDGNPYVEPAHDALVRGWQKLLMWKQQEQQSLVLQQRLTPAATEWDSIKNKDKEQPKGILDRAAPIFYWLDRRLLIVENSVTKIPISLVRLLRLARLFRYALNQLGLSRQTAVQFLWSANPYLEVLDKEFNSDDNWFNQVEAEFVQQSVLKKRRNISWGWRVGIAVILALGIGLVSSLIGQRDALIGQIRATRQSSESNLPSQELDALLDSLRAGKSLKDWPWYLFLFKPDSELQSEVLQNLRKVFYTAREHNRIQVPENFKKMFFMPNGTLLIATAGNDGIVHLQDLEGKKLPKVFSGHKGKIVELQVNRNGRLLATIDEQSTVRVWNFEGQQEEPPKLVAFIPQSEYSNNEDERVKLGIGFSPNGKKLVAYVRGKSKKNSKSEATVLLWDLSGDQPKLLKESQDDFSGISFNFKNDLIVVKRVGTFGIIWSDFMSGKKLAEIQSKDALHSNNFLDNFVLSPDGESLATYCGDEEASPCIVELNENKQCDTTFNGIASIIRYNRNGNLIVGENGDGIIDVYAPEATELRDLQFQLKGHQGSIRDVISSSDGRQFASLGNDNTIRLWQIENKPVAKLSEIPNLISISISPDGKQLAVVEKDGTVRLVDLHGNELKRFVDIQDKISQLIFSPDGQQLAAVGKDNTIRLLDLNGKELYKSEKFEKISQLIFSPDVQQLALLKNDGTIERLNLNNKTWEILRNKVSSNDMSGDVSSEDGKSGSARIAFSSDNKLLEVNAPDKNTSGDGTIYLKELGADEEKELVQFKDYHTLTGSYISPFNSIDINTQGNLLVSANTASDSGGNTLINSDIHIWDMSGKLLTTFTNQDKGKVTSISLSADGSLIATLGEDGTAKLWQIGELNELLKRGCNGVSDYLATLNEKNSDRHLCDKN
ncbi:MAG: caspase family protein [Nostoc sp.]|uniref:nSTAND1 domain-containing NTPase n=1 Tax=Nostoc sp. TaxID=1180 RepID=UPI002FF5914C